MSQLPHDFLTQLAHKYELSPEQQEAFVERFSCDKSEQAIAETLHISSNAFRPRMSGVYKKFSIKWLVQGNTTNYAFFWVKSIKNLILI